jgi:hypothetical protein
MQHQVHAPGFRHLLNDRHESTLDLGKRILSRLLDDAVAVAELALSVGDALLKLTLPAPYLILRKLRPVIDQRPLHILPDRLLLLRVRVQLLASLADHLLDLLRRRGRPHDFRYPHHADHRGRRRDAWRQRRKLGRRR